MSFETERFGAPWSARARRARSYARERAVDQLTGRTVWCAGALPGGRARAAGLQDRLGWAHGDGVVAAPLDIGGTEPLRAAAQRLESMLADRAGRALAPGHAERALYAEQAANAEADVPSVRDEDVVVLSDPLSAALAQAVRERGGHALWHVRFSSAPRAQAEEAWDFLRGYTSGVNAYLVSSPRRIVAFVPSPGAGFAKEIAGTGSDELAWASLLSDVLENDRLECVGGTIHVRPVVAAR
jgi:hypothetical protein